MNERLKRVSEKEKALRAEEAGLEMSKENAKKRAKAEVAEQKLKGEKKLAQLKLD